MKFPIWESVEGDKFFDDGTEVPHRLVFPQRKEVMSVRSSVPMGVWRESVVE
jgi:hypothetical protein